jgi:hypothetical protein
MAELSYDKISECFKYDPDTGVFEWRHRPTDHFSSERYADQFNNRFSGKLAFTNSTSGGYLRVRVFGVLVYAQRVAWLLHFKEWPSGDVDHLNGDQLDNRISNLRDVTPLQNMKNQSMRKDNTSGFCGVVWVKRKHKWRAQIRSNGRTVHLGYFTNFEGAKAARVSANSEMGFSDRHGL